MKNKNNFFPHNVLNASGNVETGDNFDKKIATKLAAFRLFLSEEKRLIPNFCPLLRSQEWQEANS